MNAEIQTLKARLEQIEQDNAQIRAQFEQSERRSEQSERRYLVAQRRLRVQAALAFVAVVGAILVSPANRAAIAQGYGTTLKDLLNRVNALEDKTQYFSINKVPACKEVVFSGVNVRIVNGLGSTDTTNGCGNLIVGYNALRNEGDDRTGSHNLILGDKNNYSSYGGLVVGFDNEIAGPYASVSGGELNRASGFFSSVSGGSSNTASNISSSVSGGSSNTAGGGASSVSGGTFNTASSDFSSVSGGAGNTASGLRSSVSGGFNITQPNLDGWSGGSFGAAISGSFSSP